MVVGPVKRCTRCGEVKALDMFHRAPATRDGRHSWCGQCSNEVQHKYRGRYREKHLTRGRIAARARRGIPHLTISEERFKIEEQFGRCPVCLRALMDPEERRATNRGSQPVIDHDHATGKFRGILCGNCNRAIGMLGDDPEKLERALLYLDMKGPCPTLIAMEIDQVVGDNGGDSSCST